MLRPRKKPRDTEKKKHKSSTKVSKYQVKFNDAMLDGKLKKAKKYGKIVKKETRKTLRYDKRMNRLVEYMGSLTMTDIKAMAVSSGAYEKSEQRVKSAVSSIGNLKVSDLEKKK